MAKTININPAGIIPQNINEIYFSTFSRIRKETPKVLNDDKKPCFK